MTVLTKQDLQDWHSKPVKQAISKSLTEQDNDIRLESCMRDTCDQTAMQTAYNEGQISGLDLINETYDDLLVGSK